MENQLLMLCNAMIGLSLQEILMLCLKNKRLYLTKVEEVYKFL